MSVRARGWLGFGLVAVGLILFVAAILVGLNEYGEGSFPAWAKVMEGFGIFFIVLGLIVGFVRLPKALG